MTQCGFDYTALCDIVRERFGVQYTLPGLKRLITDRLAGRLAPLAAGLSSSDRREQSKQQPAKKAIN
jgi:hypothetical protein